MTGATKPRRCGTNARAAGTNPRALGTNPRARCTHQRATWSNPAAIRVQKAATALLSAPEWSSGTARALADAWARHGAAERRRRAIWALEDRQMRRELGEACQECGDTGWREGPDGAERCLHSPTDALEPP